MFFMPKIGYNIAYVTDQVDMDSRLGLAVGFEAGYQYDEKLAFTAGLLYSAQGSECKGDTYDIYGNKVGTYEEKQKIDYINVPIIANYYIIPGLAVKAGIRPAFCVSAKQEFEASGEPSVSKDYKDQVNTFDFSIPMGLSYEFSNFVIDARYNLGLSKMNKNGSKSHKNSVVQLTVGYKLPF